MVRRLPHLGQGIGWEYAVDCHSMSRASKTWPQSSHLKFFFPLSIVQFLCKIKTKTAVCQVHNGSYRIFLEIDRTVVIHIIPYPLVDYPVDKGEKGLGHGVATATLRTWHRLRICLCLPFDVGSHERVAADIAFKLSFPSHHGMLFLLRAKIDIFFIASKLLGVYFPNSQNIDTKRGDNADYDLLMSWSVPSRKGRTILFGTTERKCSE